MLSRRKLAMAQYATLKVGDVKSQQIQNHSYGGEYSPPLMSNTQAAKLAGVNATTIAVPIRRMDSFCRLPYTDQRGTIIPPNSSYQCSLSSVSGR